MNNFCDYTFSTISHCGHSSRKTPGNFLENPISTSCEMEQRTIIFFCGKMGSDVKRHFRKRNNVLARKHVALKAWKTDPRNSGTGE
jgi:hypothetical protein